MPPSFKEILRPVGFLHSAGFLLPKKSHISLLIVIFVTNWVPLYTIYSTVGKLKPVVFLEGDNGINSGTMAIWHHHNLSLFLCAPNFGPVPPGSADGDALRLDRQRRLQTDDQI